MKPIESFGNKPPKYLNDTVRVVACYEDGGQYCDVTQAPFPDLSEIPVKEGKIFIFRNGRLPEIYLLKDRTFAKVDQEKQLFDMPITVSRCDILGTNEIVLLAHSKERSSSCRGHECYMEAILHLDVAGTGIYHLPKDEYDLVDSKKKFLLIDGLLKVPTKKKAIQVLAAHSVNVWVLPEGGIAPDHCRIDLSLKTEEIGKACPKISMRSHIEGEKTVVIPTHSSSNNRETTLSSWRMNIPFLLPEEGQLEVHAECDGLLPIYEVIDLKEYVQRNELFLKGQHIK